MSEGYGKEPARPRRRDDDDEPRRPPLDDDYDFRRRDTNLADRGSRLIAAIADTFLTMLCMVPGMVIFFGTASGIDPAEVAGNPFELIHYGLAGFLVVLLGGLAFTIFQAYLITKSGQTLGKKMMNVRIVRYEDGKLPGFVNGWLLRSFVPGLIGNVPYVGSIFSLVDVLFIFSEERRCLHDLIASTKVVVAEPLHEERDDY